MTWRPFGELTPLLQAFEQAFRERSTAQRLLSLEIFLLCAEKPRTMAELEAATRLTNDKLNRVMRLIAPWRDEQTGVVQHPELHLLQRRRVMLGGGHRFHLTREGRKFLKGESL